MEVNVGLDETVSWWNSVVGSDFDRDGDTDYIVGNWGKNPELAQTEDGPVQLHYGEDRVEERVWYYGAGCLSQPTRREWMWHAADSVVVHRLGTSQRVGLSE